jgi:glycerol-3-phosphate acyltransferase PlsY
MAFADIRSEIPRTFFHILGGLFLAWIGFFIHTPTNKIILGAIFAAALGSEVIRLLIPRVNDMAKVLVGPFMRPHEEKGLTGAPAFTGGVFLAFLFFEPAIALASLVPHIFGDRAGLLVGKSVGRISVKGKTLEGSLACLAASFLVYISLHALWPEVFGYGWIVLFAASLIGTLAEALPRPFDDNLTIPLAVGLFLTFVS